MLRGILLPGRRMSAQRRGLHTAVIEGIPATIIGNLLGGPLHTAYLLYLGAKSEAIGIWGNLNSKYATRTLLIMALVIGPIVLKGKK